MLKKEFLDVLEMISNKLKGINWLIVGSTTLSLQGVNIQPKDIDIVTKDKDFFKVVKLLKEYIVQDPYYKSNEFFESYFARFKINNIEVDIMGDLKLKKSNKFLSLSKNDFLIKQIKIDNLCFLVYPIESQIKIYNSMGREKDRKKIKKIKQIIT
jgi:hypothetical protein